MRLTPCVLACKGYHENDYTRKNLFCVVLFLILFDRSGRKGREESRPDARRMRGRVQGLPHPCEEACADVGRLGTQCGRTQTQTSVMVTTKPMKHAEAMKSV